MRKPIVHHNRMPKIEPNSLGGRLRAERVAQGLTQTQLAAISGVRQQVISSLERGAQDSTRSTIPLALALGLSPSWLETGKGEKYQAKWDVLLDISALPLEAQGAAKELFSALLSGTISSEKFAAIVNLMLTDINRT